MTTANGQPPQESVILAPGERREAGTAWQLRFRSDETVEDGTKRILAKLSHEMVRFIGDPESVGRDSTIHEVRRRGKQARALLRLVGPSISDGFKTIDKLYRDAGRLLAPARDARIVVNTLDDLAATDPLVASGEGHAAVRESLEHQAAIEAGHVFGGGAAPAAIAVGLLEDAIASTSALRIPNAPASLADGATRTYAGGRKAYRRASKKGTPVAFHSWRKRVKERRHQLAYLWDCAPMEDDAHGRLYELSDLLGQAHDLIVFRDHVEASTGEALRVLQVADARRASLEAQALPLGAELFAPDPSEVHRSLTASCSVWIGSEQ